MGLTTGMIRYRSKRRLTWARSFNETKHFLQAEPGCDWTERFYQYANRLAFLYFLREVNGIEAYLVFLYFLNDPHHDGPK